MGASGPGSITTTFGNHVVTEGSTKYIGREWEVLNQSNKMQSYTIIGTVPHILNNKRLQHVASDTGGSLFTTVVMNNAKQFQSRKRNRSSLIRNKYTPLAV